MEEMKANFYSTEDISRELLRVKTKNSRFGKVRKVTSALVSVASIAVIIAVLLLPVLQIYGNSMTPTLFEDNVVVSVKGAAFEPGDIVSFYYNNSILVKRVIATAGDWVKITEDGTVYVNNELLDEPYVQEKALGDCDIEFPYQVPEKSIFVMGDHRSTSKDSRRSSMGCIPLDKVVGKIIFRIWPFSEFGAIE